MKILIGFVMITIIIGLASLFYFSPVSTMIEPTQKEFIRPGHACEWWVCAYCGTKHEDNVSRCPCRTNLLGG